MSETPRNPTEAVEAAAQEAAALDPEEPTPEEQAAAERAQAKIDHAVATARANASLTKDATP